MTQPITATPGTVEYAMQRLARAREYYAGDNSAFARRAIRGRLQHLKLMILRELDELQREQTA